MKFDYIIQNPPYNKSLHLEFLKIGINMLNENGKMVIIEPATWLINVRKTGKAKLYDEIKSMLVKHVYKVEIENLNKQFNTSLYVPFSITYIDNKNEYTEIDFWCCGEHKVVNNLYDCNLIGDYEMIWSILNKIKSYGEKVGTMKDHIYKEGKTKTDENTYYLPYMDGFLNHIGSHGSGNCGIKNWLNNNLFQETNNGLYFDSYFRCYINQYKFNKAEIDKNIKFLANIYGTYNTLKNWKYFIFNNNLPLFLSILLINSQSNTIKDIIPWLTDKQYTDDEIYQLLNISEEEQEFIDRTIKKYERHSPWFKRYMCGPDSVSDEEVQKFINIL